MDMIETKLENIDEIDGILYKDIKNIINSKQNLESILFTTQLLFEDSSEVIEFMNKLTMYGYEDMALDYVERLNNTPIKLDFSDFRYENKDK